MAIYDWANQPSAGLLPAVDQLGGAIVAALWTDVVGVGGDLAMSQIDTIGPVGSRRLRLVPSQPVLVAQGVYIAAVAGDFIYHIRMGEARRGVDINTSSSNWTAGVGFVDGPTVNGSDGHFVNRRYAANTLGTSLWQYGICNGGGNRFNNYTVVTSIGGTNSPLHTFFDVILQRSGTTLIMWGAGEAEPHHRIDAVTVSAGAGLIVVRLAASQSGHDLRAFVDAFARVSVLRR